jgi:hypothetical protein
MRSWIDMLKPNCQWWGDWFMLAVCTAFLLCVALLSGCATNPMNDPAVILADAAGTSAPHPRALLVARIQPGCVWWCSVTLSVNNSEGVKAQGTAGDVATTQTQATTQTVDQSGRFTGQPQPTEPEAQP